MTTAHTPEDPRTTDGPLSRSQSPLEGLVSLLIAGLDAAGVQALEEARTHLSHHLAGLREVSAAVTFTTTDAGEVLQLEIRVEPVGEPSPDQGGAAGGPRQDPRHPRSQG